LTGSCPLQDCSRLCPRLWERLNITVFSSTRLLASSVDVAAVRDELGGRLIEEILLPFLQVEQGQSPEVYACDLADPTLNRIAVYRVHTIVHVCPGRGRVFKLDEAVARGFNSAAVVGALPAWTQARCGMEQP
jgi:hypothetical protein